MSATPMKRLYLDFNSTYRDRNLWPDPGEFGVTLSQSGRPNAENARDPVSRATPSLSWSSQRFQANTGLTPTISGNVIGPPGVGAANSPNMVVFQTPVGHLQQKENYYRHSVMKTMNEAARVLEYKYMGNDIGLVKLDGNVNVIDGDAIEMNDPSDFVDPINGKLFVPCGSEGSYDYIGQIIFNESLSQFRTITGYDKDTGLLNIGLPSIPTWLPSNNYSIRKEFPLLSSTAGGTSSSSNVVITGGNTQSDIYNGMFIRVLESSYSNTKTPPQGEIRRITEYNGNTQQATVFPPFTANPSGENIEIMPFSYDNVIPFTYRGTIEGEPSIYAIRLLRLVLPNQILSVGSGGQIAFYPYVYVELTASDIPSNNLIMSNNPNAVNMMFKASVDNIHNLKSASFISLRGDDMTQVFRFKVDTNFKVRVILPNGDTFKTIEKETTSPSEPNIKGQVSMLFELYRG